MGFPTCTRFAVTRCGRFVSYAGITLERLTYSFPSAVGQSAPSVFTGLSSASGKPPRCHFRSTRTCFATPAGSSWPTMATTRGPCSTTLGTRTSNTRSGTPTWRPTGSKTFGGTEPERRRQRRRRRQGTRAHYPRDRQAAQGALPRACRAPAQAAAAAPVHARPLTPVRPGVRPG